MKIVETNIIYEGLTFHDHQTRILEVPSWEEYCDLYRNYNGTPVGDKYNCVFNGMSGFVLPKNAEIIELKIDDFHLTCDLNLWNGTPHYKLAYVIDDK
jgi:hypothetical protein